MNEKYTGDCILQKWYVSDPLRQLHTRNKGELTRYHVEGCYPAIIDKNDWLVVQELIKRNGGSRVNGCDEHPFKGLMTCAGCGQPVNQTYTTNKNRQHSPLYRCVSRFTNSSVEIPGMTYTPPHTASYLQDPSPEMIEYREKYGKKLETRPYLCSDTRIAIDQPQKAFVHAWNTLISHKVRYMQALENNAESDDLFLSYYAKALIALLETSDRLKEFDGRLLRRTIENVEVQPTGKLTFCFRAGIKITA